MPDIIWFNVYAAVAPPAGDAVLTGTWGGLLTYITVAIGLSFLCSLFEAILLSASPTYIESLASAGNRGAQLMARLKANVEMPITAILTLNTVAHTVGAAGAGAEATALFGSQFFGLISAVLTILILVFSEIIPKTIGAMYWRQLLSFAAFGIQGLVIVLYPAVWVLRQTTRLFEGDANMPTVTRVELEAMAKIGAGEGAIAESENRVLRNLLHLDKVHVYDVMTPRTVVLALRETMTIYEVMTTKRVLPYSRIPVYGENLDDITGFVLRHDILTRAAKDEDHVKLNDFKRDLHPIPESVTVAKVLDEFVARQQHMFLVIDEYGGTAGVITMEDALESLLGAEITDESDLVADMRKMAQERYAKNIDLLNAISIPPAQTSLSEAESPAEPGSP